MTSQTRTVKPVLAYVALLVLTSIPFWIGDTLISTESLPVRLPFSALMAFNPMIVAIVLVTRRDGWAGVRALFGKMFDLRGIRNGWWYAPILLIMPVAMLIAYGVMLALGRTIIDPVLPLLDAPLMLIVFFVAAIGEETGWQGYAIDPLQDRWGALAGSLVLGVVWAAWHIPGFYHAHPDWGWVIGQCGVTVALRVLIVWLCNNNGRSGFPALLFHMMINVSNFMFPNYGSYYDPVISAGVLWVMAVGVSAVWGARTLAKGGGV